MVFIIFCRCRHITAADGFPSHIPTVDLPETPALPSCHTVSSAHTAAGAEHSVLAPHPLPAPPHHPDPVPVSPPGTPCIWLTPECSWQCQCRGMASTPTEFPFLCTVVNPRGSSARALLMPSSSWCSCACKSLAESLHSCRKSCRSLEEVTRVFSGRCSSTGKGLSWLRGHKECWKWGREKYCLTPQRSFSSLPKMTESPLATFSSHFSCVFSAPSFPCLFLPSRMRLMGYCIDCQSRGRMEIQPPSPTV